MCFATYWQALSILCSSLALAVAPHRPFSNIEMKNAVTSTSQLDETP